jgi:hypothetical protein
MERLFELRDFAEKCKKTLAVLAVCGIAGSILLLFTPLNGVIIGIAERIKPIKVRHGGHFSAPRAYLSCFFAE